MKDSSDMIEEIWRDVPGYLDLDGHPTYQVSNLGRVRTRGRYLFMRDVHRKDGSIRDETWWRKPQYLEPVDQRGFLCVRLCYNQRRKRESVSLKRLVYNVFHKSNFGSRDIIHIDGNIKNNSLSNLKIRKGSISVH